MRMDLTVTDYPNRAALKRYTYGSADVIGLQLLPILGTVASVEETAPYAAALGEAFQLTNFLRDVDEDLSRGRVYLPADELAAHGVDRELLTWCQERRCTDPRVRSALAEQHAATRSVYQHARQGIPMLAPRSRPCIATALTPVFGDPRLHRGQRFRRIRQSRHGWQRTTTAGCKHWSASGMAGEAGRPALEGSDVDHWQYLILLAACLVVTAPLEFLGTGVYRWPRRLAYAVLPVAAVFLAWDAVAIAAGVWRYNPTYLTGWQVPGPHSGRRGGVLPRHSGLRAADLHRRGPDPRQGARAPGCIAVTGLGYTLPAVLAVVVVCAWERWVLRTGLFRRPAYWISMLIVFGFQILSDGWLTKLSAPVVLYTERYTSGVRFPWDIPIEDFLFGFALVTAVLLRWEHRGALDRGRDRP